MARRFIIEKSISDGEEFCISGEEARHIFVLRHEKGDIIQVNDKICEIRDINKQTVSCKVIGEAEEKGIPQLKITLFQAFLKSDKMEFVIQKAVELGVSKVVPFISRNVVVKLDEKDKVKRKERFNKISLEASKQCGRSDVVEVADICEIKDVAEEIKKYGYSIVAYENEKAKLKQYLNNKEIKEIAIIVGAEGGFNKDEIELLSDSGCESISLGDRILRAETASLNLISILMYELE